MKKIAIHSVPRSGSTWLGSIFDSSPNVAYRFQPLFSYTHKGELSSSSSNEEIDQFYENILNTQDEFVLQKKTKEGKVIPVFKKDEITAIIYKEVRYHHILRNLLEKDKEIKVIGLIRNPLSVINSWLKAPKEFKKELGWNELEEWRFANKKNINKAEEFNGFEKWKEVSNLFQELEKDYPQRFYLLRYNDLLNDTRGEVRKLFFFVGLEFTEQTAEFISNSSNKDCSDQAYSVFRKDQVDDKWKSQLNPIIIDMIMDDLSKSELAKYLK